jgi:hypothetical protein
MVKWLNGWLLIVKWAFWAFPPVAGFVNFCLKRLRQLPPLAQASACAFFHDQRPLVASEARKRRQHAEAYISAKNKSEAFWAFLPKTLVVFRFC